jgi:hypothetical protein
MMRLFVPSWGRPKGLALCGDARLCGFGLKIRGLGFATLFD